jgi:glycine betaine catabolism B
MKLKLIQKKPETSDCMTFIFQPDSPLEWQPGQFLQYEIPEAQPDERGPKRFFTIASAPFEDQVQLTTRFVPGDGSSFKQDLQKLTEGSEIEVLSGPNGSFTIDDPGKSFVFMAGGIGITPFRSILLDLDHNQKPLNIILLYANRNDEIVFKEEFEELAKKHPELKIHYVIDPQRIDVATIQSSVPELKTPIYYLSGPKPFVDGMKSNLEQLQIPVEQIKTDYFPGYD